MRHVPTYQPDDTPLGHWHTLEADGVRIRYITIDGPAANTWLVFHGFGQRPADWLQPVRLLAQMGRVVWVELPGHGHSALQPPGQPITHQAWEHWLQALCRKEHIHTAHILGYSLGGRLALAAAMVLKARAQQVVFCGAEGASPSIWYNLATGNALGRYLLRYTVGRPTGVLRALRVLQVLGLINKSVARFAASQMHTPALRALVAHSWLAIRHLPGPPRQVADALNKNQISLRIFAGRHDRVVPMRRMAPLADWVHDSTRTVLNTGHNQLPLHVCQLLLQEALHPYKSE